MSPAPRRRARIDSGGRAAQAPRPLRQPRAPVGALPAGRDQRLPQRPRLQKRLARAANARQKHVASREAKFQDLLLLGVQTLHFPRALARGLLDLHFGFFKRDDLFKEIGWLKEGLLTPNLKYTLTVLFLF
jgi:hypothetical protein